MEYGKRIQADGFGWSVLTPTTPEEGWLIRNYVRHALAAAGRHGLHIDREVEPGSYKLASIDGANDFVLTACLVACGEPPAFDPELQVILLDEKGRVSFVYPRGIALEVDAPPLMRSALLAS